MKKKIICVLACAAMVCSLLAGCANQEEIATINSDGSGKIVSKISVSKDLMDQYGIDPYNICSDQNVTITSTQQDGKDCYTAESDWNFTNLIGSLSNMCNNGLYSVDMRFFSINTNKLVSTAGGNTQLILRGTFEDSSLVCDDAMYVTEGTETAPSYEELQKIMQSAVEDVTFKFPDSAVKVTTDKAVENLVTADGNTVKIHAAVKDLPSENDLNSNKTNFTITADLGKLESHVAEKVTATRSYTAGQFADVPANAWYSKYLKAAYESGLINGTSEKSFSPNSPLTNAQMTAICARLHSIYAGDSHDFSKSGDEEWYNPYVDYTYDNTPMDTSFGGGAFFDESEYYGEGCERGTMMDGIAASLPMGEFNQINTVPVFEDCGSSENEYIDPQEGCLLGAMQLLYGAGVITGTGKTTISPAESVTRAQAAAIIARVINPSLRVSK